MALTGKSHTDMRSAGDHRPPVSVLRLSSFGIAFISPSCSNQISDNLLSTTPSLHACASSSCYTIVVLKLKHTVLIPTISGLPVQLNKVTNTTHSQNHVCIKTQALPMPNTRCTPHLILRIDLDISIDLLTGPTIRTAKLNQVER